jgi:ABC-type glycerol-3-phosphate transport system permease component
MTKKLLSDKNPTNYLYEHIFRGDSGDGIPNVLSSDTVFVDGGRQTPLSSSKITAWISAANEGKLETVLPETVYRNYIRNSTVIDLSKTPETVKTSIMSAYALCSNVGNSKILNYLISKRCNMLVSCAEEFFTYK